MFSFVEVSLNIEVRDREESDVDSIEGVEELERRCSLEGELKVDDDEVCELTRDECISSRGETMEDDDDDDSDVVRRGVSYRPLEDCVERRVADESTTG